MVVTYEEDAGIEDLVLRGHDAVSLGNHIQAFPRHHVPSTCQEGIT